MAAGRGRGRVGVEPSGGGRNGCCLPGPIGQAGLPEPPLPPPPQLKAAPRGASSHPERAAIERAEVLGGGVCCPRGLNEADLGNIPFALLFFAHLARPGLWSELEACVPTEQELPFYFLYLWLAAGTEQ